MSKVLEWVEVAAREASQDAWLSASPRVLIDRRSAFDYAHGAGLLFGFRAGLETAAKVLEDPEYDAAPREVIAAAIRDLVGKIADAYIVKVPS